LTTTLRWGLLGTAHINRRLIPAMRASRRSSVAAVASRDAARAQAYARDWDIPAPHEGYDALLRDRTVDAIYIPLPNALHVEWTLRALDAGKHVLCEKPLALVPEDVDRIEAVARARGLVVAEAFMYRHEPLLATVLELIAAGAVGSVRTISSGFCYAQQRAGDVRLDPALGGGSLWDVGCYAVSVSRLVASAEPLAATGFAAVTESGVDESFTGLLQFPSAVVGMIHSSFRAQYRTWLEIGGGDGVLRVDNPFKPGPREDIELRRGDETQRIGVDGSPALFVRQIEDFVAAALEGKAATVSLGESRGNAAALVALQESARTGRVVTV
jgi:D-xylose 1-dehydrogenase (NADP+, D-xylono-1,5-lactone-forming)